MAHDHAPIDNDISRLIVQLLQVLLAFVLGQSIIQNRTLLIEIQDPDNLIGLLALGAVIAFTVESWIDWHVDVTRHPFQIGATNDRRRWAMGRLWLDVGHVVAVGYVGLTVAHFVGSPSASPVRHLAGYVALHFLLLGSTVVRDVTYGAHDEHRTAQIFTCVAILTLWFAAIAVGQWREWSSGSNAIFLVVLIVLNAAHHAHMRRIRMIA